MAAYSQDLRDRVLRGLERGEGATVAHGHWQPTTFIAGVRVNALAASMNGKAFRGYVRQFLCPALKPGDIVIADNLPGHKAAGG
jgi:hypothetical protein